MVQQVSLSGAEPTGFGRGIDAGAPPIELLTLARHFYMIALFRQLLPATGAPETLLFWHHYSAAGYQVDLVPVMEPLMANRVSEALSQPLSVTQDLPIRENSWAEAQSSGVPREQFDADFDNTVRHLQAVRVTGWDMVRFLSLGGGMVATTRTEGLLTVEVTDFGLQCSRSPMPAPGDHPITGFEVPEEPPEQPTFH
ncbi:hypothetical protein [Polaromonas sp.]|uniref:hypothetical protein n=1 Tax=Polaromonas sp. TaxID=1869339 RepID=UPI003529E132